MLLAIMLKYVYCDVSLEGLVLMRCNLNLYCYNESKHEK